MINLNWFTYENADCDSFNIYKAVTGLVVAYPNALVIGDTLKFSATSPVPQEITLTAVDINSVIAKINSLGKGVLASRNISGDKLYIRCTAKSGAKFILRPCLFATHTTQTPRIVTPGLEFTLVANVARTTGVFDYTYEDASGDQLDLYRLTSVKGADESLPSVTLTPSIPSPALCLLEGRITDASNHPVVGIKVSAEVRIDPAMIDRAVLTQGTITTATDEYGRFTLSLIQQQAYLLQIPAVGYNEVVIMPEQSVVNLIDISPTLAHLFSPFGDPQ